MVGLKTPSYNFSLLIHPNYPSTREIENDLNQDVSVTSLQGGLQEAVKQ